MSQVIHIVQAFSQGGRGGNPAAVVLRGQDYSPAQRQQLAARIALSETAFVLPSPNGGWAFEFYTPTRAIPHCGHATLAAFSLLAAQGLAQSGLHIHHTVDGPRRVELSLQHIFMEQGRPEFSQLWRAPTSQLAGALGLNKADFNNDLPVMIGSTGNRFLLVPVATPQTLRRITPDQDTIRRISEQFNVVGLYPFALTNGIVAAAARMFAPAYGIAEEAATGMAAGPLGAYLQEYAGVFQPELHIAQGGLMQPCSPSRLIVRVRHNKIWVGGQAHLHETRLLP
jgi:PhzF family phenazine biosynthesis protein